MKIIYVVHLDKLLKRFSTRQVGIWLTSILIVCFFIDNAINKIISPKEQLKGGLNDSQIVTVGILLLLFVMLFLIRKTGVWDAFFLNFYMIVTLVQHIKHNKPFAVTASIIVLIVASILLRYPKLISRKRWGSHKKILPVCFIHTVKSVFLNIIRLQSLGFQNFDKWYRRSWYRTLCLWDRWRLQTIQIC